MNDAGQIVLTIYKNDPNDPTAYYPIFSDLFNSIDEAFGDVNETYQDLEDLLEDVNTMFADLDKIEGKIESGIDKAASALQSFLRKANGRLVSLINSANYRIQPFLIANNSDGSRLCSSAKNYATPIDANTQFVLTNYTAEIIAPAFKKHLACTNVFKGDASAQAGDAACTSALQTINNQSQLNKVLPGKTTFVKVSGFQKGYVYEMSISALDYEGMQTTRKFYVYVK